MPRQVEHLDEHGTQTIGYALYVVCNAGKIELRARKARDVRTLRRDGDGHGTTGSVSIIMIQMSCFTDWGSSLVS